MTAIPLTIKFGDRFRDLVAPLLDGAAAIECAGAAFAPARVTGDVQADVAELSLSGYATRCATGDRPYLAIPVYISRSFRHGDFYIRTDRGIATPQDLKGKRVGSDDYSFTAFVWLRGILEDEYGVKPSDIQWVIGKQEKPNPPDKGSLSGMLETGTIDALLNPSPPSCFARGAANVRRLFADPEAEEDAWFKRTGIFPVLHIMGVKSELAARHPDLPLTLYRAFSRARDLALPARRATPAGARLSRLMGDDILPYGVGARERAALDMFLRHHHAHGLSARRVSFDELFAPVATSAYA